MIAAYTHRGEPGEVSLERSRRVPSEQRAALMSAPEDVGDRQAATSDRVVIDTIRALLRIRSAHGAAELLQRAVRDFGGSVVLATDADPDALPIDLSIGEGPALLAVAEPFSVARMQLERHLPALVEDARRAVDLLRHTERLEAHSSYDPLTGLANRRVLDRVLARVVGGVVIMVDLDHFKLINDTGGHAAGDAVLVAFGRLLSGEVRASDTCCRVGGEEFAIVAGDMDVTGAMALLERMRAAWPDLAPQPVTFSAGVAEATASGGRIAMLAADRALYRAKERGRDRTEVAVDPGEPAGSAEGWQRPEPGEALMAQATVRTSGDIGEPVGDPVIGDAPQPTVALSTQGDVGRHYVAFSELGVPAGGVDALVDAFTHRLREVEAWPGFEHLEVWQDERDATRFVMVSWWASNESFSAYMRSSAHRRSHDRIPAGPDRPRAVSFGRFRVVAR